MAAEYKSTFQRIVKRKGEIRPVTFTIEFDPAKLADEIAGDVYDSRTGNLTRAYKSIIIKRRDR